MAVTENITSDRQLMGNPDTLTLLQERTVAVKLFIPKNNGRVVPLTVIGVYAPTVDTKNESKAPEFWLQMTNKVNSLNTKIIISGDFNVVLDPDRDCFPALTETSSSPVIRSARRAYLDFLSCTGMLDLWSSAEFAVEKDWTFSLTRSLQHLRMLDRTATRGLDSSFCDIRTIRDLYPSDHRPILSHFRFLSDETPQLSFISERIRPEPRTKIPDRKKHQDMKRVERFVRTLDNAASQLHWPGSTHRSSGSTQDPICESCASRHTSQSGACSHIANQSTWLQLYDELTDVTERMATAGFTRPVYRPPTVHATTKEIRLLLKRIKACGRLVRSFALGSTAGLVRSTRSVAVEVTAILKLKPFRSKWAFSRSVLSLLSKESCQKHMRDLDRHRRKLQCIADKEKETKRINDRLKAVMTGSKLLKSIGRRSTFQLPDILDAPELGNDQSSTTPLVTGKDAVHSRVRAYFSGLLHSKDLSHFSKPWMEDEVFLQRFATSEPFVWPRALNLSDLDVVLRGGRRSPSPGPDGCEKWWFSLLPKDHPARCLLLRLLNYSVIHNFFPSKLKSTILLPVWKGKGSKTDLTKYRGIMFSNLVAVLSAQWATRLLQDHAEKHKWLPPLQIATRSKVQTRDVTSFLAQLEAWAKRSGVDIYAAKRDKEKGFDFQHKTGFWDCCRVFHLPAALQQFDEKRLESFECRIRTSFGDTEPLLLDGVNKQGDSMSPFKYVLLAALAYHWVEHQDSSSTIKIMSQSVCLSDVDAPVLRLRALAVMDDDIQFCLSKSMLQRRLELHEEIETAYGASTNWTDSSKTGFYVLSKNDIKDPSMIVKTMSGERSIPRLEVIEFLRCSISQPDIMLKVLKSVILNFELPRPANATLPLRALRRILKACLVPRVESRLRLQPVLYKHAYELDSAMTSIVAAYYGWPVTPRKELFFLAEAAGGEGFPSLEELNFRASVDGILRDLNHHNHAFRSMSKITYEDWRCTKAAPKRVAKHAQPFQRLDTYLGTFRSPPSFHELPLHWKTAWAYLAANGTLLIENDRLKRACDKRSLQAIDNAAKLADCMSKSDHQVSRLATDGSVDKRFGVACGAVVGDISATARMFSRTVLSMHAELLGLALALSYATLVNDPIHIYTDYAGIITILERHRRLGFPEVRLNDLAPKARSWQRLLICLYKKTPHVTLHHVKAHQIDNPSNQSVVTHELQLNKSADIAAKSGLLSATPAYECPQRLLDFDDDFFLQGHDGKVLDCSVSAYCATETQRIMWNFASSSKLRITLDRTGFEPGVVLRHRDKITRDYSYRTLLLIKAQALPVAMMLAKLSWSGWLAAEGVSGLCKSCGAEEDVAHVFVHCPAYASTRVDHTQRVITQLRRSRIELPEDYLKIASSLYKDDPVWPRGECKYYNGTIPELPVHKSRKYLSAIIHSGIISTIGHIWSLRERFFKEGISWDERKIAWADLEITRLRKERNQPNVVVTTDEHGTKQEDSSGWKSGWSSETIDLLGGEDVIKRLNQTHCKQSENIPRTRAITATDGPDAPQKWEPIWKTYAKLETEADRQAERDSIQVDRSKKRPVKRGTTGASKAQAAKGAKKGNVSSQ